MKQWTTPAIEQLSLCDTEQGTMDSCPDMFDKGAYNGPGSDDSTLGGMCS